ncbi:MAG: hypothetical protein JRJ12_13065 [Deltaproteobacteria bacterium]|nr:hypothetical protein [Deltaproteobacteria bacterium]
MNYEMSGAFREHCCRRLDWQWFPETRQPCGGSLDLLVAARRRCSCSVAVEAPRGGRERQ